MKTTLFRILLFIGVTISCFLFTKYSDGFFYYKLSDLDEIKCDKQENIKQVILHYNSSLNAEYVEDLTNHICYLSDKYDIKKSVILAIFAHESRFNPYAKNKYSSAVGIGQIIPRYWVKYLGVTHEELRNDWKINAESSVRILRFLKDNWGHKKDWPSFYYNIDSNMRAIYLKDFNPKLVKINKILDNENG